MNGFHKEPQKAFVKIRVSNQDGIFLGRRTTYNTMPAGIFLGTRTTCKSIPAGIFLGRRTTEDGNQYLSVRLVYES